jgi:capsid protein
LFTSIPNSLSLPAHAYVDRNFPPNPFLTALKEAQAAEVGLRNGIVKYSDLYAQEGKDWEESFEQRKREQAKLKELGLEVNNGNNAKQGQQAAGQETPQDTAGEQTADVNAG